MVKYFEINMTISNDDRHYSTWCSNKKKGTKLTTVISSKRN